MLPWPLKSLALYNSFVACSCCRFIENSETGAHKQSRFIRPALRMRRARCSNQHQANGMLFKHQLLMWKQVYKLLYVIYTLHLPSVFLQHTCCLNIECLISDYMGVCVPTATKKLQCTVCTSSISPMEVLPCGTISISCTISDNFIMQKMEIMVHQCKFCNLAELCNCKLEILESLEQQENYSGPGKFSFWKLYFVTYSLRETNSRERNSYWISHNLSRKKSVM